MDIKNWINDINLGERDTYHYHGEQAYYPITDITVHKRLIEDETKFEIDIKLVGYTMNVNVPKDDRTNTPFTGFGQSFELDYDDKWISLRGVNKWELGKVFKRVTKPISAMLRNILHQAVDSENNDRQFFLVLR